MNPQTGRFISEDPACDGINWYAYAGGNPVRYSDPSGLWIIENIWKFCWEYLNMTDSEKIEACRKIEKACANPVQTFRDATRFGYLDDEINLVIGARKDDDDIFHIKQHYWQSWKYVGYNEFYDVVFDWATKATGTSMLPNQISFQYNNEKYLFWFWKGDYINLGAGAELGIYYGGGPHWLIDTSLAMTMTLSLKKGNEQVFYYAPEEKQWWITGFDTQTPMVQANDLSAVYTVTFDNFDMYESFKKTYALKDSTTASVEIDDFNQTITIKF